MSKYSISPLYADLNPLPLDPGGPSPIAAIAYSADYAEAMAYLRALMAADEKSERALEVTEDLVEMNPAHYTVWLYRMGVLRALATEGVWGGRVVGEEEEEEGDEGEGAGDEAREETRTLFEQELDWLNDIAQRNQKNYQIWQHRQGIVLGLAAAAAGDARLSAEEAAAFAEKEKGRNSKLQALIRKEQAFIERMFELDAKNYHVWSYRQWLVRGFGLLPAVPSDSDGKVEDDGETTTTTTTDFDELAFTDRMLRADVRNNSAWCHRWFILNASPSSGSANFQTSPSLRGSEMQYVQAAIRRAPQNQSAWNYLRGLVREAGILSPNNATVEAAAERQELRAFIEEFAGLGEGDGVVSSFALDLGAEVWGFDEGDKGAEGEARTKALKALELLETTYDPLRARYWGWRRGVLMGREGVVV